MALTIEQRIKLACKIRDIQFRQESAFSNILKAMGIERGSCNVSDDLEEDLRDVFIGILGLEGVLEDDPGLYDTLVDKFYCTEFSNEALINMLDDFIE